MRYPVDALIPLLHRVKALPEFYQGRLDGYVNDAVAALESGLVLFERMAADKAAAARANERRRSPLRVIEGQRPA
jgi:hypothetical protein